MEEKIILYENKKDCCGCAACASVCPQDAICMEEDREGFLYPQINEQKCIKCKKCVKVCPVKKKHEPVFLGTDRVGIITLYYENNNYGGMAQAYALWRLINDLGYDAELITYKRLVKSQAARASLIEKVRRNTIKSLMARYTKKIKNVLEKKIGKNWEDALRDRTKRLKEFRESIPHSKTYTMANINECASQYSIFVSGSDQIWKPGVVDGAFVFSFLDGIPDKNIFSYASSVAVTTFPDEYQRFMKKELTKYSAISVREEKNAAQLSDLLGYKIVNVCDPTLLLSPDQWQGLATARQIEGPYIFAYLLGNNRNHRKIIQEFAKREKKILVTIPHIKGGNQFAFRIEDWRFGDIQMKSVGMEEFFSLIKYADCIVTDSFHATVFSYIFERPFWVFERITKDKNVEMNSRIYDLLGRLGLENRIIKGLKIEGVVNDINFDEARRRIEPYLQFSRSYLEKALKNKKSS